MFFGVYVRCVGGPRTKMNTDFVMNFVAKKKESFFSTLSNFLSVIRNLT